MKVSYSSIEAFCKCPASFKKKQEFEKGVSFNESSRSGIVAHALFADKFGGNEVAKLHPFPTMEEYNEAEDLLHSVEESNILRGGAVLSVETMYSAFITADIELVAKGDLVIKHPDGLIEAIDLKTGWKTSSPADDNQGVIAAYAVAKTYGVTEVKFTKYFVVFNDFRSETYGPADFKKLEDYLKLIVPLMKAAVEEENPHKTFGAQCVKCPYVLDCNMTEEELRLLDEMSPSNLEAKIDYYDGKKKACEGALKKIVQNSPEGIVKTDGYVHVLNSSTVLKVDSKSEVSKTQFISKMLSSKTGREKIIGFLDIALKDCAQLARLNGVRIREEKRQNLKRIDRTEFEGEYESESA